MATNTLSEAQSPVTPASLPASWLASLKIHNEKDPRVAYLVLREAPEQMLGAYRVQIALFRPEQNPPDWIYIQASYAMTFVDALRSFSTRSPIKDLLTSGEGSFPA